MIILIVLFVFCCLKLSSSISRIEEEVYISKELHQGKIKNAIIEDK